jgi:ABC-type branched-subunit amino acid transport system substrate-binding protein
VRLALREANAAGGVAGYAIELVAYDDGGNPAVAADQVRKLDVDPDVLGALGHFRHATTAAALDTYARTGLPLVVPTGFGPGVTRQGVARSLAPPIDRLASALIGRAVQEADGGAVVLVRDGEEGPLGPALQRAAEDRGLTLTVVPAGAQNWRATVLADDPAVLLSDLDPVRAGEVVSALHEGGWSGAVLGGPALAAADFTAVAGAAATGTAFVTPWPFPSDAPGGAAFAAAYSEISNGTPPGPLALPAFHASGLLLEALEQAARGGTLTREGVAAALFNLDGEGELGQISLASQGETAESLYWYRIGPDGVPRLLR